MAEYKVRAPNGEIVTVRGPEGADPQTVIQKAKELFAKAQSQQAPEGTVAAGRRRAGGPGYKPEAYQETPGLIQFNEDEDAAIKAAAGGDAQKEYFLRLAPTIEWRGNADLMRSKRASPKGALGPYQFMPATAASFGVQNRLDFGQAVQGASKFYDELNRTYKGNLKAMLAHYNGGRPAGRAVMAGEEPPAAETREYLQLADKYGGAQRVAVDTTRRELTTGQPEQQGPVMEQDMRGATDPMTNRGRIAVGVADVAATVGTAAVGQIVGGIAGLGSLLIGRGGEKSAETVKNVGDALTWSPKSEAGQAFMNFISPYAEKMDVAVKDASSDLAGGNPLAAAAIETGGNALLMLVGPGAFKSGVVASLTAAEAAVGGVRGVMAGTKAAARTMAKESTLGQVHVAEAARKAQQKHIADTAKALQDKAKAVGIELRIDQIHKSVRKVAEGMSADQRGSGFRMLSDKLTQEHLRAKSAANKAWIDFRNQPHFVDVSWAPNMVKPLATELASDGLDITLPRVADSLEDLRLLNKRVHTAVNKEGTGPRVLPGNLTIKRQSLNELQAIRSRIQRRLDDAEGSEAQALGVIGRRFDDMLDAQFRADAQLGIDAPWEAWKSARKTWESYKSNWNEFKIVSDILKDPDMTPQKLANELLGTSAMLGSKQSSRIYDHIMMLTKNDPGIKIAVEGSVMYDLLKPLLDNPEPKPGSFGQVANNIRKFRKENPELIKSMGLDDDMLRAIQHGARAAEHTKLGEAIGLFETITQGITRHLVGHEIAQAGFRVRLAEKIVNRITKKDATSHKEMLAEFAGIDQTPLTHKVARDGMAEIMLKGELASQYQDLGEWGDTY